MKKTSITSHWMLILGGFLVALLSSSAYGADLYDTDMQTLVVEYKTAPAKRIALRTYMQDQGLKQLEAWKKEGRLFDYRVLFSRYVDNKNWDMLTLLRFADATQAARWKEVERLMPAGLPPATLATISSIDSNPADTWFQGGTRSAEGVYLVIPYDYLVSTEKYLDYVRAYLLPQLDGWLDDGALASYQVLLGRYAVDRHWSALLVLEYRGDIGIGLREKTTKKVRRRLAETNPAWLEWSKDKSAIRVTRQYVLADELRALP